MLPVLHVLCLILVLPYLLLAAGFVFLAQTIRGSLWHFLDVLLSTAAWLVSGGGLFIAAGYLAMVAMVFFHRTRPAGVILGAVACLSSISIVVILPSTHLSPGQWLFLAPGIGALVVESWLVFRVLQGGA